jgi:deoxyribonuclease-4
MPHKLYIGPHVPLEETFYSTLEKSKDRYNKFNLIQIFMGPPVGYHIRRTSEETLEKTGSFLKDNDMKLYVHAPYVINLASQEPDILEKGRVSIQKVLDTQSKIGNYSSPNRVGTVLHVGAKGPLSQVVNEINDLNVSSNLYLENAAQNKLGNSFDDLRRLCEGIDSQNVGFCIDTCHTHSSGLADMRDSGQVLKLFEDLNDLWSSTTGTKKSSKGSPKIIIHLNDSKTKYASKQDKHSILGYGSIWDVEKPESFDSLFTLLELSKTYHYDIILETPSIDVCNYEYEIMKNYI